MRRKQLFVFSMLISAILLFIGCDLLSHRFTVDERKGKTSIIFGHIDINDAPSTLGWVKIKQVLPRTGSPYHKAGVANDYSVFWVENLKPGAYQVLKFGGKEKRILHNPNTKYEFQFPEFGRNQTAVRFKKPGIYFMGSFKYKLIDSGSILKPDNFKMIPVKSPSELKVLKSLLDVSKGTKWEKMIKRRIRKLRRRRRKRS